MIRYRHRNCDKAFTPATFAYDLPPATFFEQAFSEGIEHVGFPFGSTLVNSKDNYCKATGRHFALSRTKSTSFKIQYVHIKDGRQHFHLTTPTIEGNIWLIKVSTNLKNDNRARLDYIELYSGDVI